MWQATANYRDLWLQLPSRIERHAKLRSFHIRRTWCSLQRLSDLLNADFLLCLWIDSNASFPRLTAASTRFGSAVQTKGFGVELVSAMKRLIATWRSTRERKTPRLRRRLVSLAKEPSTALSQDAEVGVKWNVQRGCRASHLRGIMAQTPQGALKVPRAFGVGSGHSPSAILSLPAFVSRSPPDNSCMYPSLISRSLCSAGIARCIKPLAQSRNETNSSWVNGGAGAIPRICAGFPSGRSTSSNVATWVLSNQDSNTAPQTSQDT